MKLVQSGFGEGAEWDDEYQGVNSGWEMVLAVLRHYLENYFGRPRSHALAMLSAEYTASELRPFYRDEKSLARWLTRAGGLGEPGTPYELTLMNGDKVAGEVLADTGTEVQLSWTELEGAMALKAFSLGPQKMLAIDVVTWAGNARLDEIEQAMASALERLKSALTT